ncbi:hypothetical protein [Microbispora siamensis]|uniref:IS110 family transposase n=1 Tax=Microbispora siamensis TaxID=564413 RepID=A0ABQ4H1R9_9ACTN|nr:hypothetical protein [Microbispora siamensis]GIH67626.1 hypothetical protein Msi02_84430 [Microbispora siamensis]
MVSQTARQGIGPKGFASVAHKLVVPGSGVAAARQFVASVPPHCPERPA